MMEKYRREKMRGVLGKDSQSARRHRHCKWWFSDTGGPSTGLEIHHGQRNQLRISFDPVVHLKGLPEERNQIVYLDLHNKILQNRDLERGVNNLIIAKPKKSTSLKND
jgi:hypothetical protein